MNGQQAEPQLIADLRQAAPTDPAAQLLLAMFTTVLPTPKQNAAEEAVEESLARLLLAGTERTKPESTRKQRTTRAAVKPKVRRTPSPNLERDLKELAASLEEKIRGQF